MRIEFTKMQGLGNDFVIFDAPKTAGAPLDSVKLRALADRHLGVGFDQALMLEAPRDAAHRASYRIFNSDGGEVEQCGNGARCIAALLYARAPELGREISMESAGGTVHARVRQDGLISVDMGAPDFDPRSLPMDAPAEAARYSLDIEGETVDYGAVSMGNPHAVLKVHDVKSAPVEHLGPRIERHRRFHGAPMWDSCRSWTAGTSACAYSSAASARLWPAARAPARPLPSAANRDFWRRTCGSICPAARPMYRGTDPATMSGSPGRPRPSLRASSIFRFNGTSSGVDQ